MRSNTGWRKCTVNRRPSACVGGRLQWSRNRRPKLGPFWIEVFLTIEDRRNARGPQRLHDLGDAIISRLSYQ